MLRDLDLVQYSGGIIFHGYKTFAVGIAGYHYEQITGDSGAGARLGDFKGRVTALGALLTYSFALGKIPVSTQWTYFHEFDVENRVEGDAGLLTYPCRCQWQDIEQECLEL